MSKLRERSMGVPIVGRICADDSKKILDALHRTPYGGCWILVTQGGKRSKKFLGLAVFGVEVDAHLIDPSSHKATKGRPAYANKAGCSILACGREHRGRSKTTVMI